MKLRKQTSYLVRLALLSALALALSVLEGIFTPILPPGAKAGISNIVTMYAALSLGLPSALAVAVIKAFFAFVTRGVIAFGMSGVGGIFSATVLYVLFRFAKNKMGTLGISIAGAAVHNAAQGLFALLIFGKAVLAYLPVLVILSLPAGALTGAIMHAMRAFTLRKDIP